MTYEPGTALEFFAGIGLARMGLERAGWKVVFANDFDPKKREMHEGHWGRDDSYVLKSVFDVEESEVPDAELCWASFPCVDLSLAGNRAGLKGAYSSAYWGFARLMADLGPRRPPLIVVENVPGLLSTADGEDMLAIVSGLASLGYSLDILEVNAHHFVPQSRARLFIVGASAPYALAPWTPDQSPGSLRSAGSKRFMARHPDLPWGSVTPAAELPNRVSCLQDYLETFPESSDIWWDEIALDSLVQRMSAKHRTTVEKLQQLPMVTYGTVYRRVRPTGYMAEVRADGVAGCLRTPRGGSSRQFVLEMGRGQLRARHMTAIEYGRLQGASEFRIAVPALQALFGFGDAVCVPAVEWLARHCLDPLRGFTPSSVRQLELLSV